MQSTKRTKKHCQRLRQLRCSRTKYNWEWRISPSASFQNAYFTVSSLLKLTSADVLFVKITRSKQLFCTTKYMFRNSTEKRMLLLYSEWQLTLSWSLWLILKRKSTLKEPINASTPHHQFSQDVHNMVQRGCLKMYITFIKVKNIMVPCDLTPTEIYLGARLK